MFHHFPTPRIKILSALLALKAFSNYAAFSAEAIDGNAGIVMIPLILMLLRLFHLLVDCFLWHFLQNANQQVCNHCDCAGRTTVDAELQNIKN